MCASISLSGIFERYKPQQREREKRGEVGIIHENLPAVAIYFEGVDLPPDGVLHDAVFLDRLSQALAARAEVDGEHVLFLGFFHVPCGAY